MNDKRLGNNRFNRFCWGLPTFLHNALRFLTDWTLVEVHDEDTKKVIGYAWTRNYPKFKATLEEEVRRARWLHNTRRPPNP